MLLLNFVVLQWNINHHLLWMFISFIPFGYIQYRFYNILKYNEQHQDRMFIAIIGLKSFCPTLSCVAMQFHSFNNVEVAISLKENIIIHLIFYLLGLICFIFMMLKSEINYSQLIKFYPKFKR